MKYFIHQKINLLQMVNNVKPFFLIHIKNNKPINSVIQYKMYNYFLFKHTLR